jgi:hypothetical protein
MRKSKRYGVKKMNLSREKLNEEIRVFKYISGGWSEYGWSDYIFFLKTDTVGAYKVVFNFDIEVQIEKKIIKSHIDISKEMKHNHGIPNQTDVSFDTDDIADWWVEKKGNDISQNIVNRFIGRFSPNKDDYGMCSWAYLENILNDDSFVSISEK